MAPRAASAAPPDRLPIRMLFDRVLVSVDSEKGERKSGGGILIPATASVGKRLSWARSWPPAATSARSKPGDRVLFDPEDRHEVELQSKGYILLREKDIHAVAASRVDDGSTRASTSEGSLSNVVWSGPPVCREGGSALVWCAARDSNPEPSD
jgi:chaperonin GroES